MSKERKINIILALILLIALLLEFYLDNFYIYITVLLLEILFIEIYERKTGTKLYRRIENKKIRYLSIGLCIALLVIAIAIIFMNT